MSYVVPLVGAPKRLESWRFSTVVARDGLEVSADDIGRVCYVAATQSYYYLASVTPVTWTSLSQLTTTTNITITNTVTQNDDRVDALHIVLIINPTDNPTSGDDDAPFVPIGGSIQVVVPHGNTADFSATALHGLLSFADYDPDGEVLELVGVRGIARVNGDGAEATHAIGVVGSVAAYQTDAIIHEGSALRAFSPDFTDKHGTYLGGTIATLYGLYIDSQESAYVEHAVGIYVEGQNSGNMIEGRLSVGLDNTVRIEPDPTGTDDKIGVYRQPAVSRPVVTGSWADGTAGASLAAALATIGWIVDTTTS